MTDAIIIQRALVRVKATLPNDSVEYHVLGRVIEEIKYLRSKQMAGKQMIEKKEVLVPREPSWARVLAGKAAGGVTEDQAHKVYKAMVEFRRPLTNAALEESK